MGATQGLNSLTPGLGADWTMQRYGKRPAPNSFSRSSPDYGKWIDAQGNFVDPPSKTPIDPNATWSGLFEKTEFTPEFPGFPYHPNFGTPQNPPSPYGGVPGNIARETNSSFSQIPIQSGGDGERYFDVASNSWKNKVLPPQWASPGSNPQGQNPAPGTTQPMLGNSPPLLPRQQPINPTNPMPFLQGGRKQTLGDFIRPVDVDPRYGTRNLPQSFIRRQVDGGPSMSVRQAQPTTPGNPTAPALPPALQPTPSTPTPAPGTTLPGSWIRPDGSTGTASPNFKMTDADKKWIERASDILRRTENTPALSADQRNDMIKSIADLSQDKYDWKTGKYKGQDTFNPTSGPFDPTNIHARAPEGPLIVDTTLPVYEPSKDTFNPTSATRNPLDSALSEDQFFKQNPRGNYQEYRDFYDKELLRKQSEVQDNGFQAWVDTMTRIGYNTPEFRQSLPRLTQENEAAIQGWLNRNPGKTRADYYINSHRPV